MTPLHDPNDDAIMRRVRDGERNAMSALFARHQRRLHAVAHRLLGDSAAAEDAVQQSFLQMLHRRHTFRDDSRFLPWAYQILRNCCADYGNRVRRRAEEPLGGPSEDLPAQTVAGPQREASDRQELGLLRDALLTLSFERREVIVLARLEERSSAEIAELLGCSQGAVRVRLHRAVADLRAAFHQRLTSTGTRMRASS